MTTGPRRIGKYELQLRLGRGGMAEVWKALDPYLQRYVAIKFLHADLRADPDFMKRFEREAMVVASLHHPNIVQVHDFQAALGEEGGISDASSAAYMVMDYIEGEDLANYIRKTSRMNRFPPAATLVNLFVAIGAAIDYAHSKGMIHRDIKPANILLDARNTLRNPIGEPILTDFGIVKLLGSSTGSLSGSWLGTPNYISPEQAHGKPGNERSDIYALGVILYEMCTGMRPFQGDNPLAIIMQHITAMPTPPALINPSIPPALSAVILRSLAKDPEARFATASALTVALAQALNVPVPAILNTPTFQANPVPGATYQTPSQPSLRMGTTPTFPTPSALEGRDQSALATSMTPPGLASTHEGPLNLTPTPPFITHPEQEAGSRELLPAPPVPTLPHTPGPGKRGRAWLITSIALLIIVLAGAVLSAVYFLSRKGPVISSPAVQIVGQMSFQSSGPVDENSVQGIEDEVKIDLHDIPALPSGKGYFAWLVGDANQHIALGPGTFANGNLHWFYQDPRHANLLGIASSLLITQENAISSPSSPSSDSSTWRYSAEIPSGSSDESAGVLASLRNLLYEDTKDGLVVLGIHGGLNIQLLRNTHQVSLLANQASSDSTSKNTNDLYAQIVSILTYLDGTTHIQQELPANTPVPTLPPSAQIPLRNLQRSELPTNYVDSTDLQVTNIEVAPGASPELYKSAAQIDDALQTVRTGFEQLHKDAYQLVMLAQSDKSQLLSSTALSLLNDMETQADQAYLDVMNIYGEIQNLPTFNISPYKA